MLAEASINLAVNAEAMAWSAAGLLCLVPDLIIGHHAIHTGQLSGAEIVAMGITSTFAGLCFHGTWDASGYGRNKFAFKRVKSEIVGPKTDHASITASHTPVHPSEKPATMERIFAAGHKAEEHQRVLAVSNNLAMTVAAVSILSPG
jgi:hypothetical protein